MFHKTREREREKKKRERESERASWMPNDMVSAGSGVPPVEFPSSVLPVGWMCATVFAWLTPSLMDCRVWSQVIAFEGAYHLTHLLQKNSCNTKVIFNNFDRDSYIISNIFCVWYLWRTGSNGPNRVNRDMSRLVLLALNSFLILARLSRCTHPSGSV